jgi:hypothetical protein
LSRHCLLEHVIAGKIKGKIEEGEDEEEDVVSYWRTSRKQDMGN